MWKRTEVLSAGRAAPYGDDLNESVLRPGRNGCLGPVRSRPLDTELLPDSKESPGAHGPVLDRGPSTQPARVQQAEAAPPQGRHPGVLGRYHGEGAVPDPADPNPRYLGDVRDRGLLDERDPRLHPPPGPHVLARRRRVGNAGPLQQPGR